MAAQASTISSRYASELRGIEQLLGPLDLARDVAVLDGVGHDQVDLYAKQGSQLVEQTEVSVGESEGFHGAERYQEIEVALAWAEVVAKGRSEDVKTHDAEA